MDVECIKAFGNAKPGEVVRGLPDDAAVDPEHWRVVPPVPPSLPPEAVAAAKAALGDLAAKVVPTLKEQMLWAW